MVSICSPGFPRKRHLVGKFSTRFRLSVRSLFCLFQHTNYLFGNIKVAPGKSLTGRVKFKISAGTWDAKFSLGKGKNPWTGSGFTGPVRADLHGTVFVACDKRTTGLRHDLRLSQRFKTCFKMLRQS